MDSREANAVLRFAREELSRYLMLAGWPAERIPRIVVDARDEAEDAYIMEGSARRISVSGSNPRSALIGIYAYLKEIGFAFFAPGKDYTVIPELRDEQQLLVPETSARAVHSIRGVCIEGAESLEHMLDYVDWMPKAGMNICFI